MTFKALPIAILLTLTATPVLAGTGPSVWTLPGQATTKAPVDKDATLSTMRPSRLTLKDVVVARYAEEPAGAGLFRIFRKMTVVDRQLADRDLYIPWLSRDEALPKVGAHCDIRYHMGSVGGGMGLLKPEATKPEAKAEAPETPGDSRIMDDFSCKPIGKT